jgi:hypothetical protein
MGSVAIDHWGVTISDLSRVVQNDDLSQKVGISGWVILGIRADVTSSDFFLGDVHIESDIVTWNGFSQGFVMHLDGLDFSGQVLWCEGNDHTRFQDTGLNSANWDGTNITDFVDILNWQSERFISWSCWGNDAIKGFKEL